MALKRFQETFGSVQAGGDVFVLAGASVEVRDETSGALAAIFDDRAGSTAKANPFTADSNGYGFFYAADGRYRITATLAGETVDVRDVLLGSVQKDFDTVSDMDSFSDLSVGDIVRTLGYNTIGDGGGNAYEIVAAGTGTDDGGSFIDLGGSGHQAKGLFTGGINVVQFGALPGSDCTTAFQSALNFSKEHGQAVTVPHDDNLYHISTITIPPHVLLTGEQEAVFKDMQDFDISFETSGVTCIKAIGTVNTPVVQLSVKSSIKNLRLVDLRQKFEVTALDESFNDTQIAVQLGYDGPSDDVALLGQKVENISFLGFKRFVEQYYSGTGTPRTVENLHLRRLYGMPFEYGVHIRYSTDTCWAEDCQFIYNSLRGIRTGDTQLLARTLARTVTAWRMGRADGFQVYGCQALAVKYFWHSYKDAYQGDGNEGGGFNVVNSPIDVCGIGYKLERGDNNAIGGNIVGGQIIPHTVLPNGEENCAVYVDTAGSSRISMAYSLVGVSIHDGGTNSDVAVNSGILGPNSVKTPEFVARYGSSAAETSLSFVACRLLCGNDRIVDYANAFSGGNKFTAESCIDENQEILNISLSTGSNANVLVYNGGGEVRTDFRETPTGAIFSSQGTTPTSHYIAHNGYIDIRTNGISSGFNAFRFANNGNFFPVDNVSQNCGQATNRWSNVYSDRLFLGGGNISYRTLAGSPEGVVTAPPGSICTNSNGGAGTTLYVKESGTGNTGWVAK